jgi:hypothetical protein
MRTTSAMIPLIASDSSRSNCSLSHGVSRLPSDRGRARPTECAQPPAEPWRRRVSCRRQCGARRNDFHQFSEADQGYFAELAPEARDVDFIGDTAGRERGGGIAPVEIPGEPDVRAVEPIGDPGAVALLEQLANMGVTPSRRCARLTGCRPGLHLNPYGSFSGHDLARHDDPLRAPAPPPMPSRCSSGSRASSNNMPGS